MRNELLAWFAREGLLLQQVVTFTYPPDRVADDPVHDEVKIAVKAPVIALSRADRDVRECPDPALFGYPPESLEVMTIDDMHQFVYQWLERAVEAGLGRCFVCNKMLDISGEKPWDAVFVTSDIYCWLLVHFDCKRYLSRDLKGRHPFEITPQPPEFFDLRV